ncbi:MAG: transglutaminase-like domain-containing protein [Candidatus Bathyarchaeia archaeon]
MLLAMMIGLLISGCAHFRPENTYEETVSAWTSYKDVETWMRDVFKYDHGRLRDLLHSGGGTVYPTRITFLLKGGVCWDGARFIKETLDRINPAYEAQIVYIDKRTRDVDHYVCSFKLNGKLYIMDYATVHGLMRGTHGPYNSLEDYKAFIGYLTPSPLSRQKMGVHLVHSLTSLP